MRPKASRENLHVAAAFTSAITVQCTDSRNSRALGSFVYCRGPASIYAALQCGLPDIVRDTVQPGARKKNSISQSELIKFLCRSGYIMLRYRQRVRGETNKWSTGFQVWKNIRWVDPSNGEDMRKMQEGLEYLALKFPSAPTIQTSCLMSFLSSVAKRSAENPEHQMSAEFISPLTRNRINPI
jgi:hypothetical protein